MWDSGIEFVKFCSKVGNMKILFDPKAMAKVEILMKERKNIEWLCYLIGEIDWDERITFVNDIYVPTSQGNSIANIDNIECPDEMRKYIIGPIHSHHSMGCFFSKDDWDYLNNNNDISIVVSDKDDIIKMLAAVRFKTDCGCYTHIETEDISVNYELDEETKNDFMKEIEKIDEFGINEFYNFIRHPGQNPSQLQKRDIIKNNPNLYNFREENGKMVRVPKDNILFDDDKNVPFYEKHYQ